MLQRYAVIDLGTNLFHLLIAEAEEGVSFKILLHEQQFVKLGAEGLTTLGRAPFERGLQTMRVFHGLLRAYGVERVRAIGTAALRTASNGPAFLAAVQEQTGIAVQLISGEEEALWIYKGVRQAVRFEAGFSLIVDIGGGSVEFILVDPEKLYWRQSFPIGMAVLYRRFHQRDPLPEAERQALFAFLEEELQPLWRKLSSFPPHTLVGASGPFEILRNFLPHEVITPYQDNFNVADFLPLRDRIAGASFGERLAMEKLPRARADMIVVALELIYFVLQRTGIRKIAVSAFAMQEGILSEML